MRGTLASSVQSEWLRRVAPFPFNLIPPSHHVAHRPYSIRQRPNVSNQRKQALLRRSWAPLDLVLAFSLGAGSGNLVGDALGDTVVFILGGVGVGALGGTGVGRPFPQVFGTKQSKLS